MAARLAESEGGAHTLVMPGGQAAISLIALTSLSPGDHVPNTRLVWCESPGSVTMEVEDVPAIAAVARRHGAAVALDNTYSAGVYFDAFAHGADVTMQALTQYVGGHGDLLLGTATVKLRNCSAAWGRLTSVGRPMRRCEVPRR